MVLTLESVIQLVTLIFVTEVVVAILVLWKDILSFLFPGNWFKIEMIHFDLSCKRWLQSRSKDHKFTYEGKEYFLYHNEDVLHSTPDAKMRSLFSDGRLKHFKYHQGFPYPITPEFKLKPSSDDFKEMLKREVDGLWYERLNIMDVIAKNLLPLLAIIGLVIIVIVIVVNSQPPPLPTSTGVAPLG